MQQQIIRRWGRDSSRDPDTLQLHSLPPPMSGLPVYCGEMQGVPARWGDPARGIPAQLDPIQAEEHPSRDPYPPLSQKPPLTNGTCFTHIPMGARNRYHLSNWPFNPETAHFLDPKRLLCWPTFDMCHVKQILVSKYYKIQHLGVSLQDFLFP